jgi:hypothetical protein
MTESRVIPGSVARSCRVSLLLAAIVAFGCDETSVARGVAASSMGESGGTGVPGGMGAVGGTSGHGGTGAPGGTGGPGGTAGDPSPSGTCHPSANSVDVVLIGSDGNPVTTSFDDQVVVASIERCADAGCTVAPWLDGATVPVSPGDLRIMLDGSSGGSLTLYLKIPQMPIDMLKVGAAYRLTAAARVDLIFEKTVDQTVTLSSGGKLVVFAADLSRFSLPLLPNLDRAGVALEDAGVVCNDRPGGPASISCGVRQHAVRVTTTDGGSAVVQPGETAGVAGLSFTSDSYEEHVDTGQCDLKSETRMAAFASSPCSGSAPDCAGGPANCCGDLLTSATCQTDGQWTCPSGYVRASACTDYHMLHSGGCPL